MNRVGFVCGLKSEAVCLPKGAPVAISGADPDRAAEGCRRLIAKGAEALVSFGLAGGLDPILTPGDIVLPREVVTRDGSIYTANAMLVRTLTERAPTLRLLGADAVVTDPAEKAHLLTAYDAQAVDMESHRVAAEAGAAGLPFAVFRAIGDPADRALPSATKTAIAADGSVRTLAMLKSLARHPATLPSLLTLGRDSAKAHRALRMLLR